MSFWTSSKREFRNCNFTDMKLVIDWFCNSSKVLFHWNSVKHQSPGHGTKDFGVKNPIFSQLILHGWVFKINMTLLRLKRLNVDWRERERESGFFTFLLGKSGIFRLFFLLPTKLSMPLFSKLKYFSIFETMISKLILSTWNFLH